jgi:hypothetical protein
MTNKPKENWEKEFNNRFLGKNEMLFRMGLLNEKNIKDFIRQSIQKTAIHERYKTIRELDKKYNKLCEEKVKDERERIIKELEDEMGDKINYKSLESHNILNKIYKILDKLKK